MAILKFQFASNNRVNLNFDMKYLGNEKSDLQEIFLLFVRLLKLFQIISKLKIWFQLHSHSGLKVVYIANWVKFCLFCLPQTLYIFCVCVPLRDSCLIWYIVIKCFIYTCYKRQASTKIANP